MDAIRYMVDNGCKRPAPPVNFPPNAVVYRYLRRLEQAQATANAVNELRRRVRMAQAAIQSRPPP